MRGQRQDWEGVVCSFRVRIGSILMNDRLDEAERHTKKSASAVAAFKVCKQMKLLQ